MVDLKPKMDLAEKFVEQNLCDLAQEIVKLHDGESIDSSWKLKKLTNMLVFAGSGSTLTLAETLIGYAALKFVAASQTN